MVEIRNNTSFIDLVEHAVQTFTELVDDTTDLNPVLEDQVNVGRKVMEAGEEQLYSLSNIKKANLLYLILNAGLLSIASNGTLLSIGNDIELLGGENYIHEKISKQEDSQTIDWLFSIGVQASLQHSLGKKLQDLIFHNKFKAHEGRLCDYLVEHQGVNHLYECTSISNIQEEVPTIGPVTGKIKEKIRQKQVQLLETEEFLGKQTSLSGTFKHLCIDISRYFTDFQTRPFPRLQKVSVSGFWHEEINKILDVIDIDDYEDVDNLTICWKNVFLSDEHGPVGVVGNSMNTSLKYEALNYNGWRLETFPLGKDSDHFRDTRIATQKKNLEYFTTAYNNHYNPDSFRKWEKVSD